MYMIVLNADFHVARVEKMQRGIDLVMKSHSNVSRAEFGSQNLDVSLAASLINSGVLLNNNTD